MIDIYDYPSHHATLKSFLNCAFLFPVLVWCYIKKVDTKPTHILQLMKHKIRRYFLCQYQSMMKILKRVLQLSSLSSWKISISAFKRIRCFSAVSRWVKQYSEVKLDDDSVISAQQIKELQKKMSCLKRRTLY